MILPGPAGCDRQPPLRSYQAPKNLPPLPEPAVQHKPPPQDAGLIWTLPEGWKQGPGGPMRVATLTAGVDTDSPLDITVHRFNRAAGGLLANINRWRTQQMGLAPIKLDGLADVTEPLTTDSGLRGGLIDLKDPQKTTLRTLVAMFEHAGESWFFKAQGQAPLVARHEAAFGQLARSIRTARARGANAIRPFQIQGLQGMIPAGWQQVEASPPRLATFTAGEGEAQAKVVITRFPGDVGGELPNVNRWRRQAGLAAINDMAKQDKKELDLKGAHFNFYKIVGPETTILVASTRRGPHSWFIKMVGQTVAVEAPLAETFLSFVLNLEFDDGTS